jgi:bla regulator protein blaR1
MLKKSLASLSLLLLAAAVCSLPLVCAAQATKSKSSSSTTHVEQTNDTDENRWTWHNVDDHVDLQVTIRGKVEFAEDYSDITAISPTNGELRISERRGGVTRKFEATPSADGIKRAYSVNGEPKPLDAEARAWLAKLLNDTVRQGGYDAPARVTRLLERGGPSGVLAEISKLQGDYVKRLYFSELLKQGNLDAETARLALRQAAREISSDYEKAEMLIRMAGTYLRDDRFRSVYLEGAGTIHSDYERGRALKAVLKKGSLDKDNLLFVLKSVNVIESDYEKAELLVKLSHIFPLDESLQMAFLDAARTIKSDYEKGRAITGLLDTNPANQQTWLTVVKGATLLDSDYEKAQLLIRVADTHRRDETVRNALTDAARGIQSEHERGRVLSAIYR